MQLHELQRKTPNKDGKRVGRGRASGKGKTAGRGTKGQNARAGHKKRPDVREKLKKLPKLRGYKFTSIQKRSAILNLSKLEAAFSSGDAINPAVLLERGLISAGRGKAASVKILGDGDVSKKFIITGCAVSASAKEKIEKAGGSISLGSDAESRRVA
jgi:large subunit ribosomal protein L15